jgi:hypothetical protein
MKRYKVYLANGAIIEVEARGIQVEEKNNIISCLNVDYGDSNKRILHLNYNISPVVAVTVEPYFSLNEIGH